LDFLVKADEVFAAAEGLQRACPLQAGGDLGGEFVIRGVRPVAEIGLETVFLRVLMDIDDQAQ